jgi:ABC-2 type transport system ATP-binding protein
MPQTVRTLSLGQRMLADLCAVMLHAPQVLFLDEPTLGLDVITQHAFRQLLRELARSGLTILLTTHDLTEIEHVADRVILLDDGRVRFDGSLAAFRATFSSRMQVVVTFTDPTVLPDNVTDGVAAVPHDHLTYSFRVASTRDVPALVARLASLPTPVAALNVVPESLEDIVRAVFARTAPGDAAPHG